ncbi:MAG: squalene cyclase [Pseudoclavibacter sp.]
MDRELEAWLLDSDPALRWQVERDLLRARADRWKATRALVATEGFGAKLLSHQDEEGTWAGGAFFPKGWGWENREPQPWTTTTWVLKDLREWGLDASVLAGTAEKLETVTWEYDDLPYWHGEVDCCINSWTLSNGLWLGAEVDGIVTWFLQHQQSDGGWNCEWVEGAEKSSFHSTLNSLIGLLDYQLATGDARRVREARRRGRLLPRGGARGRHAPGRSDGGSHRDHPQPAAAGQYVAPGPPARRRRVGARRRPGGRALEMGHHAGAAHPRLVGQPRPVRRAATL